jgi:tetratricopeptide (TPR) repeat protein
VPRRLITTWDGHARLARRDEAIKAYTEAIRVDRDYGRRISTWHWRPLTEGRVPMRSRITKTLRVKPDYAAARFNLALSLFATGQRAAALDQERALRTVDDNLADQLHRLISK